MRKQEVKKPREERVLVKAWLAGSNATKTINDVDFKRIKHAIVMHDPHQNSSKHSARSRSHAGGSDKGA